MSQFEFDDPVCVAIKGILLGTRFFLTWTLWLSFFASSKFIGQTQFSQLKLQPLILIE